MKKTFLLNSELSYCISKLGHKDSLVIGDAGLPVAEGVQRIDLAVSEGIPSFMQVLEAVLAEQKVEKIFLAEEMRTASKDLHQEVLNLCSQNQVGLEVEYLPHEDFKQQTESCKCAVRTGEFTPYANVILVSGVVF
ncbi:D-ribose pyranase [Aminipila butyrica]|uniref:D-ribose pyranase n=1 Tax=Aminipila butyrica TaxID=433296 RepID=A0A858BXK0_9FIRM|nr:D-ribose pyranase [Aminipila butyrica]QIB70152.1 D-ribose pyranase [Aminipila butyrica]